MTAARTSIENGINTIAASQYGVVTRTQLLSAGLSSQSLDRRIVAKRLRPLHRGVYLVGPVMVPRATEMAAVLACGPRAAVSHRSAAVLWELLRDRGSAHVDVTVAGGDRRRPNIAVHRSTSLKPSEVVRLACIPVTTVARTLFDLAASSTRHELERALEEALSRRLTSQSDVLRLLARHEGTAGARTLRALLVPGVPAFTRSEAETRLLALIRKVRLPLPDVNVPVCGLEVDFFWRAERLVVEMDGFASHSSAARFENDRRRDAMLIAAGLRVTRVTWRQLVEEPEALIVRLAQALARSVAV